MFREINCEDIKLIKLQLMRYNLKKYLLNVLEIIYNTKKLLCSEN